MTRTAILIAFHETYAFVARTSCTCTCVRYTLDIADVHNGSRLVIVHSRRHTNAGVYHMYRGYMRDTHQFVR